MFLCSNHALIANSTTSITAHVDDADLASLDILYSNFFSIKSTANYKIFPSIEQDILF